MALEERREILAGMIEPGGRIQFSEPLPGEAKAIFHLLDKAGLEGIGVEAEGQQIPKRSVDQLAEGQVVCDRRVRSARRRA
ncbi:hypothetical protein NKI53_30530, partial [Mesorhizobium sp. M0586]